MTTLAAQRRVTRDFIRDDPTEVVLTPYTETITDGGGRAFAPGSPRAPQTFKLIPMTFDQRPTVTAGGVERIIDYTLLGTWDCEGDVWDRFTLDNPNEYFLIVAITNEHGYSRKFLCERHFSKDGVV